MIFAVGIGTFLRILYSLNLVAIRLTLFIYCDWDGLDENQIFLNHGQRPTLPEPPQLLDPLSNLEYL